MAVAPATSDDLHQYARPGDRRWEQNVISRVLGRPTNTDTYDMELADRQENLDRLYQGKARLSGQLDLGLISSANYEHGIEGLRQEAWRDHTYGRSGMPTQGVISAVQQAIRDSRQPWRAHDYASQASAASGMRMAGSPWFQEQLGILALPTRGATDEQLDGMNPIYDRLQAQAAELGGREVKRVLGDIGDGASRLSMVMKGRRVGLVDAYVPGEIVSDRVDQLIDRPPAGMGEISFGWEAPDGRTFYGELPQGMRPPMGAVATDLKKALPELLDEMGLQEGDLVRNQPVGVGQGDYRRAMTYARQGFGPVDGDAWGQLARINSSGGLSPELLIPAHQGYAEHFRRRVGRRAGG